MIFKNLARVSLPMDILFQDFLPEGVSITWHTNLNCLANGVNHYGFFETTKFLK